MINEIYALDLHQFKKQMAPMGVKVQEVGGDGNCLFRSIADQVAGDESLHMRYRKEAVDYLLQNKNTYSFFMNEDKPLEEYCREMKMPSVWGGQLEMNALAHRFQFNVIVHQINNPSIAQIFFEPFEHYPVVHLSFHLKSHYSSLRRADDPCTKGVSPISEHPIGHDLEANKLAMKTREVSIDAAKEIGEEPETKLLDKLT